MTFTGTDTKWPVCVQMQRPLFEHVTRCIPRNTHVWCVISSNLTACRLVFIECRRGILEFWFLNTCKLTQ
ncbi:hypothetical protein FKM82_028751 [Ascaphus truei]